MVPEVKSPFLSKTLWMSLIVAIVAFIPSVGGWISKNPEMFSMTLGGIFAGLRLITKGKISIE